MGHNFKKKYGQNFISDTNFLNSLVAAAGITADDEVLEIGAGAGGLTAALARAAKKVVAYEIDKDLKPALSGLGFPNLTVVYKDIMQEDCAAISALFSGRYKLVANLPYYITTPVIFKFLDAPRGGETGVSEMALMVQKEVAERITAAPGSKDYGALTAAVNVAADTAVLKRVSRNLFYPVPGVDSCFISIKLNPGKFAVRDKETLDKLIKAAFAMRRKTLANNLCAAFGFSREDAEALLTKNGIDVKERGERLSPAMFVKLAGEISGFFL